MKLINMHLLLTSAIFLALPVFAEPTPHSPPAQHGSQAPTTALAPHPAASCPHSESLTWKAEAYEKELFPFWTGSAKHPVTGQLISVTVVSKKQPTLTGVTVDKASGKCQYEGVTHDNVPFKKMAH